MAYRLILGNYKVALGSIHPSYEVIDITLSLPAQFFIQDETMKTWTFDLKGTNFQQFSKF